MKKKFITGLMLAISLGMNAQEEVNLLTTRETSLNREYLRPSMTMIFLIDGSSTSRTAAGQLQNLSDLKFDRNIVNNNVFVVNDIPNTKKERDAAIRGKIESLISEQKIGNQIMKNWFPTFEEGKGYGWEVLMERGKFAATDNDILTAEASQRGADVVLNSLGQNLIDRSYVVFYYIKDASSVSSSGKTIESVNIIPYVYKLDFNDEVKYTFYTDDYWKKPTGIDEMEFPLLYVMNGKSGISTTPSNVDDSDLEDLMTIMGKKIADFQAKTQIVSRSPVCAKIGKKEGVRVDKRYAIMEYRMNKKGEQYAKRIATLRARKVADNNTVATGHTEDLSKFYYIKGRRAKVGMTLVENPDLGLSFEVQYNMSAIDASIGYRLSRLFNSLPGLITYLNVGLANNGVYKMTRVKAIINKNGKESEVPVLRGGLGIAKEFNFARNFVLTPNIGGGVLWPIGAKDPDDLEKISLDSYYVEGAVKLGYMCTRNFQLFGEFGYTYNILGNQFKYMLNRVDDDLEPGNVRVGLGVKLYF